MKRLAALLICLTVFIPSLAQDAPTKITPENAAALTLLESAGSALPSSVRFSPDGRYILATTTDETFVFPADDPDAEPQIFPFQIAFDADGYLIGGGQRWNLDTGQSIGIPPSLKVIREREGDPAEIEVVKPGGETLRVETTITGNVARLAVNDDYSALAVATGDDYRYNIYPPVYLYALPTGRQIAALPQITSHPISNMFFTLWGDSSLLVVETMETYYGADGSIAIYRAATGVPLPQYSGLIRQPLERSADGAFAYLLDNTIVLGTGSVIIVIPSDDRQMFGEWTLISLGDNRLALYLSDGTLRFTSFDDSGTLNPFVTVEMEESAYTTPFFVGDGFVFIGQGRFFVWDMTAPTNDPRIIEIEAAPALAASFPEISPDFTRYSYEADGLIYVRDSATHELLAELPPSAVISPDWSRAAYWDGALLTVEDFAAEQDYLHEVNPRHLGRVADFENGYAAFIDEMLQVVDVDSADGHTDTVTIDGAFEGAQFFGEGACIVTFDSVENRTPTITIHSLNLDTACEEATYEMSVSSRSAFVTPRGKYIYDTYCGSDYVTPELAVYPLNGYPGDQPPTIIYTSGCGENGIAFNREETTAYIVKPTFGLQLANPLMPDTPLNWDEMESLLNHLDPVNRSYTNIASVFLSPTEDKIAVYVEDSKGADYVQERYIEVFALDDLEPGTLRRDVRPLLTIPDATVATFSPDGRYVVTDKGLYSVEFSNATPAVNGAISAFSPDSQLLATYQDGFVTLWRVPQPSATNFPLAQYDIGGVRELVFSADGTRLYIVRAGEVQVWGVDN